MKKIPTLFTRGPDHLVTPLLTMGCQWVQRGEGEPTVKIDGSCCMLKDGFLYKRSSRKLTRQAKAQRRRCNDWLATIRDFKDPPNGWIPAQPCFDPFTGHWPGWLIVGNGPEDQYHMEAFVNSAHLFKNETCELVGPTIRNNPYHMDKHLLWSHHIRLSLAPPPTDFDGLCLYLGQHLMEGIVWHHPDGRMAKSKRRDFGFEWPLKAQP